MSGKVLIVDDDANLIAGLRRQLRKQYDLMTAQGGEEALAAIHPDEPIAVLVCDMRMPGMDGLEVLKQFRQRSPATVRMMLTGNAHQHTAINAINQGAIFRFFTKPTATEDLTVGIDAALEQYRLVTAERDLLERTLAGSVKVLTGVLSLNDPESFGRALRMREWVRRIAKSLGLKQRWQLEVAIMLAPLGIVAIPPEVMTALRSGRSLSAAEASMVERAPEAARDLIINIPRLKTVADIVYLQDKGYDGSGFPEDDDRIGEAIPFDARVIKVLNDLSKECDGPVPDETAFNRLAARARLYDPRIFAAIREAFHESEGPRDIAIRPAALIYDRLPVRLLLPGDHLRSDIRLENGCLILRKGVQLTEVLVARLRNIGKLQHFDEPVEVERPSPS